MGKRRKKLKRKEIEISKKDKEQEKKFILYAGIATFILLAFASWYFFMG